jgi:hypothetical protein
MSCDDCMNGGNGIQTAFLKAVIEACLKIDPQEPGPFGEMCGSPESMAFLYGRLAISGSSILNPETYKAEGTPLTFFELKKRVKRPPH